jgi:hypothetical protein
MEVASQPASAHTRSETLHASGLMLLAPEPCSHPSFRTVPLASKASNLGVDVHGYSSATCNHLLLPPITHAGDAGGPRVLLRHIDCCAQMLTHLNFLTELYLRKESHRLLPSHRPYGPSLQ